MKMISMKLHTSGILIYQGGESQNKYLFKLIFSLIY